MSPAFQEEAGRLRESLQRLLVIARAGGEGLARERLAAIRLDFEAAQAKLRAERTRTLRGNLAPPARAQVLRDIAAQVGLLSDLISQTDAALAAEVAA